MKPHLIGLGGCGWVYKLNDIAIKKSRPDQEERLANEQDIFEYMGRHSPSPHIVQSFYRVPNAIFLEYGPGGTVMAVLQENLEREGSPSWRVIRVLKTLPVGLCTLWMKQLCAAVSWLENLGLCHADIRPNNMLLFSQGHVKLADFDETVRTGVHLEVGIEPFARLLGDEDSRDQGLRGTYGNSGPRTEQFAIGSVMYSLTRGQDPLENEWWGKEHWGILQDKFQRMEFPPLGASDIDMIIDNCWHGRYRSVAELFGEVEGLDSDQPDELVRGDREAWEKARIAECEAFVERGRMSELRPPLEVTKRFL